MIVPFKDNIIFIFGELNKKAYFNSLFDFKQREAFVNMLILSHLGWTDEYHTLEKIEQPVDNVIFPPIEMHSCTYNKNKKRQLSP